MRRLKNIPISIVGSSAFAVLIYGLITISVIALIGVKAGGNSVSPLGDAYGVKFGKKVSDVVDKTGVDINDLDPSNFFEDDSAINTFRIFWWFF